MSTARSFDVAAAAVHAEAGNRREHTKRGRLPTPRCGAGRRTSCRATSFKALVLGFLVAGASAANASANSYDVYACYAGAGTYVNPGASAASWTLRANNPTADAYLPYNQCGSRGPNGFGVISHSGYVAPAGEWGAVDVQAPEALHIRRVQLWRSLYDYGVGSGSTSQRNYAWNTADGQLPGVGDDFDGSVDVPHGAAGSGSLTNHGITPTNYLDINLAAALPSEYTYVVGCGFPNGCATGGQDPVTPNGPDTILDIYGAIVSIEDDVPPTITLDGTGLLDGGVQSGTVPMTIDASAIAGIARVELYVDGASTPAFAQDFTNTPHCQFWELIPCQDLEGFQMAIDTSTLQNGRHYMTVAAYDPAGNVATVSSPAPVTVENQRRPTPNGTPCPGEALAVKIDGKRSPAIIGYGRHARLTGVLSCRGVAMAGARVAIVGGGVKTSAVTAANGGFAFLVPRGHSRELTISYTAYNTDTKPAAVKRVTIAVRPRIKLIISPHRTTNGATIVWRGRIIGGPYPATGIPLQVQVREGGRWQTFDEIEVSNHGRIGYRYTFERTTSPTRYSFRVALPRSGAVGYPYAYGASNVVRVLVR
jgi:hypothetical protein